MTLFLIPTPLADQTTESCLPAQIREIIQDLEVFLVEDLRTARRFVSSLRLGKKIEDLIFYQLSKNTPEADTKQQLQTLLKHNQNVGVLSEAGCPGVADPGAVAVKLAHQLGIEVVPLVGPSSILLALMGSGLSGQSFVFHGYLPIERADRIARLKVLEKDAIAIRQTQIFIETPYRNNQVMKDIAANLHADTLVTVACNLTATDGFVKTLNARQWQSQLPELHKKPTVFLIGKP
jgi:16S rRNA (cytidine1402-2'-O)-methyltransferase